MKIKRSLFFFLTFSLLIFLLYQRDIAFGVNKPNMQEQTVTRAKAHLLEITKENHKFGSEGNKHVRDYIKETLDQLGVSYEVLTMQRSYKRFLQEQKNAFLHSSPKEQAATSAQVIAWGFENYEDYVNNMFQEYYALSQADKLNEDAIFVKLDQPDSEQGVMLTCHFDNAPNGVGAADDGTAVAAMLEAIRTASALPATNDMYFLFTDGEELDLFGATTFVQKMPTATKNIPLILNYEARGISGSLILFETSENNSGAVNEVLKALSYEYGYSIFSDIFKFMPNYTDLTVFMKNHYTGINFAYAQDYTAYHNLTDSPEYLSDASFYETVINQQDAVTYFSNSDLSKLAQNSNLTFFTLWKGNVIAVNSTVFVVFSFLVGICAIALAICLWLKSKPSLKRILLAIAFTLSSSVVTFLVIFLAELPWTSHLMEYQSHFIKLVDDISVAEKFLKIGRHLQGFMSAAVIITWLLVIAATCIWFKSKKLGKELQIILLLFGAVSCLLCVWLLKGSAYMFSIPLACFIISVLAAKQKRWVFILAIVMHMLCIGTFLLPIMTLLSVCMQMSLPLWCDGAICVILALPFMQVATSSCLCFSLYNR